MYYNQNHHQPYSLTTNSMPSNEITGGASHSQWTSSIQYQLPTPVGSESGECQQMAEQSQPMDSTQWGTEIHSQETGYIESGSNGGVVSISTSFYPKNDPRPDTVFVSSDGIFFYITYQILLDVAPNAFRPYLNVPLSDPQCRSSIIMLDAPGDELNIIFHGLYNTTPAANSPAFETLVRAIDRMSRYGILAETVIKPKSPIYDLLLAQAPLYPLDSYALAAHHNIAALASTVSTHLLSHDMLTVSDEMAERIGPLYLKRLLLLHSDRFKALKDILLRAPVPHPETSDCTFEDQRKVTRAWALVSAYLVWDATPDISTHTLSKFLNPLLEHIACKQCENILKNKIKDVMVRWTAVKRTI